MVVGRYLVPFAVIDLWVFCSIANAPQNGRLAGVRAADDKDPEATEFFFELLKVVRVVGGFCRHAGTASVNESTI